MNGKYWLQRLGALFLGLALVGSVGLPWDEAIHRDDPLFVAEYNEFAYEVVRHYRSHPAWSGLAAVWGGSADVWDHNIPLTDPEVVVPLLNAAYEGIKRADPDTIVIGFNFATTANSTKDWEEFHRRAFALSPKFDWYGVQSHNAAQPPNTRFRIPVARVLDAFMGMGGEENPGSERFDRRASSKSPGSNVVRLHSRCLLHVARE